MEELWDIARVAAYLGVSERTVYNRVRSGELPAIKVGRLWRVRRADLRAWLGDAAGPLPAPDVPGPYPYASATEPVPLVAESGPMPSRSDLERLLAPLIDPLERRLAFVGLLSKAVESLGWPAPIVVGGNAVEYYTDGDYPTVDIDLAGASEPVAEVLDLWDFRRQGRHWYDETLRLILEVPGTRPDTRTLEHVAAVHMSGVIAYVLGVEDVVVDRLCAAAFWNDRESQLWALTMLRTATELDLDYLRKRAAEEDVLERLEEIWPEALS